MRFVNLRLNGEGIAVHHVHDVPQCERKVKGPLSPAARAIGMRGLFRGPNVDNV